MPSYNRVILIGRLTRDPELRYTASGLATTSFSIAVDRRFKNQQGEKVTDFFRCKAWRQQAEFVSTYIQKGRLVAVDGRIEMNEVVGQDGQKRYFTDIVCDTVEILESNREGMQDGGEGGGGMPRPAGGMQGGGMQDGGGDDYYPDEDAPAPRGGNRPAAAGGANAGGGAPRAAAGAPAGGGMAPRGGQGAPAAGGRQPAPRQPEPAYPADDYDDSDPFADE
jgi:single-strand DNA-binding protein